MLNTWWACLGCWLGRQARVRAGRLAATQDIGLRVNAGMESVWGPYTPICARLARIR